MSKSNLVKCPYVSKHRVQSRNFLSHIQKCAKKLTPAYLNKFVACKYNNLHIFTIYEIGAHEMACPNRNCIQNLENQLLNDRVLLEQISRSTEQNSVEDSKALLKEPSEGEEVCPQSCHNVNDQDNKGLIKVRLTRQEENQPKLDSKLNKKQPNAPISFKNNASVPNPQPQQKKPSIASALTSFQQKKAKNDDELEQCKECSSILCDVSSKLWKNKKLVKYLKAYSKLVEQHEQIKEYIQSMKHILSPGKNKRSKKNQQKSQPDLNLKQKSTLSRIQKAQGSVQGSVEPVFIVDEEISFKIPQKKLSPTNKSNSHSNSLMKSLLSYVSNTEKLKPQIHTQQPNKAQSCSSNKLDSQRNKKPVQVLLEESSYILDTSVVQEVYYEAAIKQTSGQTEVTEAYQIIPNEI